MCIRDSHLLVDNFGMVFNLSGSAVPHLSTGRTTGLNNGITMRIRKLINGEKIWAERGTDQVFFL